MAQPDAFSVRVWTTVCIPRRGGVHTPGSRIGRNDLVGGLVAGHHDRPDRAASTVFQEVFRCLTTKRHEATGGTETCAWRGTSAGLREPRCAFSPTHQASRSTAARRRGPLARCTFRACGARRGDSQGAAIRRAIESSRDTHHPWRRGVRRATTPRHRGRAPRTLVSFATHKFRGVRPWNKRTASEHHVIILVCGLRAMARACA